MVMKTNYVCGFCNKAFTRNASLKRHKTNVHMRPSYHCITCKKHSKKCLSKLLEDDNSDTVPTTRTLRGTNTPNTQVLGVRKSGKHTLSALDLFICCFCVMFNSQGDIATGSLRLEEPVHTSWSRFCTVNHRASASNYQVSNMKSPARDLNQQSQRLEVSSPLSTPPTLSAEPTPQNTQFMSVTRDDTPSTSKTTPPHTSDLPQDTHTMSHHFISLTNKSFKYYLQLNNMFLNQKNIDSTQGKSSHLYV